MLNTHVASTTGNIVQNVMSSTYTRNQGWGYLMQGNYPNQQDQTHLNTWPLVFTLGNDPNSSLVGYRYQALEWNKSYTGSDRYSQCVYQSFETDQGLEIFIAGDDNGETLGISSISLQYGIDSPTQQPTSSPSNNPTTNPTEPTKSPSKYPSMGPTA